MTTTVCSATPCQRPAIGRSLCKSHYYAWYLNQGGREEIAVEKAAEAWKPWVTRFLTRIAKHPNGCWEWEGSRYQNGYGGFHLRKTDRTELRKGAWKTHVLAYRLFKGEIPLGMDLDHLCRNRGCCNPDHLEPVTRSENLRRGDGPNQLRKRAAQQTHCKNGHPLFGDNLYIHPSFGTRGCRICRSEASKRHYSRRKEVMPL